MNAATAIRTPDQRLRVGASERTELNTLTVTFALVAATHVALAEGDARRAAKALGAAEAELVQTVRQEIDPAEVDEAFAAGADLTHREAAALARGETVARGA